jgi:hypothetical protein
MVPKMTGFDVLHPRASASCCPVFRSRHAHHALPRIHADPDRILQALVTCSNAAKFAPAGTAIEISADAAGIW